MTHQAPNPGDAAYDPADPHGFHKDAEGNDAHHQHHVTSWQFLTAVLFALIFLTVLTVVVAKGEAWVLENTGFPITQLWNVIIAMTIATVKAGLVCMYFMHLRHDNPLNTFILLFTLVTLGLFLTFPAIDTGSRGEVNPFKAEVLVTGGTGQAMTRKDGTNISGPIVFQSRREKIDDKAAEYAEKAGREEPSEEDLEKAREYVWFHYYDAKAEKAHGKPVKRAPDDDLNYLAKWKQQGGGHAHGDNESHGGPTPAAARHGLTPGLFDASPDADTHTHDRASDHDHDH